MIRRELPMFGQTDPDRHGISQWLYYCSLLAEYVQLCDALNARHSLTLTGIAPWCAATYDICKNYSPPKAPVSKMVLLCRNSTNLSVFIATLQIFATVVFRNQLNWLSLV